VRLRTRIALLTALATAVAVVAVSASAWFLARHQAVVAVDGLLDDRAAAIVGSGPGRRRPPVLTEDVLVQFITPRGVVVNPTGTVLPVTAGDLEVAAGDRASVRRSDTVEDVPVRILTVSASHLPSGGAVMLARPLTEVDDSLARLGRALVVLSGLGVLVAGLGGLIVAGRAMRPVARLTEAAEHVAETEDLDAVIEVDRQDELGRLAQSFNLMLGSLATSRRQQRRLVTDASHELRTPLTALKTNLEVLRRVGTIEPGERERILDDVIFEADELATLVGELVDLATDEHEFGSPEVVDLTEAVTRVAARETRRSGRDVTVVGDGSRVVMVPALLDRVVGNLVGNALKFSPRSEGVEIVVSGGRIEVLDRGPGVPDADKEAVFERFYRSDEARTLPGNGLGLSIVKAVVERHGGSVRVEDREGGGARFVVELPEAD